MSLARKIDFFFFLFLGISSTVYAGPNIEDIKGSWPGAKWHSALTRPVPLTPGQVSNDWHEIIVPAGPISVFYFQAEIVEKDAEGNIIPVPTNEAYLHHHLVGSSHNNNKAFANIWTPMKPPNSKVHRAIGFGAGAEARKTAQAFKPPFAFVTEPGETSWWANVHIINMRTLSEENAHRCLECPCTTEDIFDKQRHTLNGVPFDGEDACNRQLLTENNTGCYLDGYYGGLHCCEHGEYCQEKETLAKGPVSTFYLRYTIGYVETTNNIRPLFVAACCDATGYGNNSGNTEYDVPKCDTTRTPVCVHTLSTVQYVGDAVPWLYGGREREHMVKTDKPVDLVYALAHQHRGGMGVFLYDDATGELICASSPHYGTGTEAGNENGYVTEMSSCVFDPPRRMRTTDKVKIVALYNSTVAHTGVMSLLYLALTDIVNNTNDISAPNLGKTHENVPSYLTNYWFGVVFAIGLLCGLVVGLVGLTVANRPKVKESESVDSLLSE